MSTEERPARPWDIFNKNLRAVPESTFEERMDICRSCEHFIKLTSQCKRCGCFMNVKTKLTNASCPEGKWHQIHVPIEE